MSDAELHRELNDLYFGSPAHGDRDTGPCREFLPDTYNDRRTLNGTPACARCGYSQQRHLEGGNR